MNTRIITTEQELIAFKEDWDTLVQSNPETDMPFYSWEWFYRSYLHFGKPEGQELFVVVAEDAERLTGVLPLVRYAKKQNGLTYRHIGFCNTGITPRNTLYYDEQYQEQVFQSIWNMLFGLRKQWDMISLANIPETAAFHRFILNEHKPPYAFIQTKGLASPYIQMEGMTYDEYFSKYGNKDARRRYKRASEKYEAKNKHWRMEIYESSSDIQKGIDLALDVRKESWKGVFQNQEYVLFYRELFADFAHKKEVLIPVLMLDEIPIAAQFMTGKNGQYHLHTNDYHTGHRETSPGLCLLHLMLIEAFNRQWKIFDFTGSDYKYKEDSCTDIHSHSTFQIFHSGLKSCFIYWAKTLLLPLYRKMFRKPQDNDFIMCRSEW